MGITLVSYQEVRDAYKKFSFIKADDPKVREARKTLFSSLAGLYSPEQMAGTAFAGGVYFRLAQRVIGGQEFIDHPESLAFLMPKAELYTQVFQRIMHQAQESPSLPENLSDGLSELRKAHIHFMNAFITEYERVYPESPDVICVNYKDTIKLFVDSIIPEIECCRQLIAENDPSLFSLIPKLAIEKLLKEPRNAPELCKPFANLVAKKRASFIGISEKEKENLHLKLLGESVELEPTTLELFKSIEQISYLVQRSDAKTTNLVFRETMDQLSSFCSSSSANRSANASARGSGTASII